MINRNGDRLEGTFVKDKLEGEASVFLANGSEFHGYFKVQDFLPAVCNTAKGGSHERERDIHVCRWKSICWLI